MALEPLNMPIYGNCCDKKFTVCNLTPSTPAVPNCRCSKGPAPYWSNPPFLIFDIRALWRSVLSARAPECQILKIVGQTSMVKCKALTGSAMKARAKIRYVCRRCITEFHSCACLSGPIRCTTLHVCSTAATASISAACVTSAPRSWSQVPVT